MKQRILSAAAVLTAAVLLLTVFASCGKPSIVKTEEGKKLTAHAWETNYFSHSEVRFEVDGTLKVKINDNNDEDVEVPGKWSIDGTTLTTTIEKMYEDGNLVEKPSTVTYTYADFMSDAVIDGGDESVAGAKEQYEKGTQWYVSDKYLYFSGSVWIPLR